MPEVHWSIIAFGCVGGLLPDILRVIQNRHDPSRLKYLTKLGFLIGLVFLVVLGGFLCWLLGANDIKQALAYGFGGPEILSKMVGGIAGSADRGVDRGAERGPVGLFTWWRS
jgi:hypothetical protein